MSSNEEDHLGTMLDETTRRQVHDKSVERERFESAIARLSQKYKNLVESGRSADARRLRIQIESLLR